MSTAFILPDELIPEILSWLSVKSLIRFRCVSKAWNSLTFNPNFIKLHFQRSPKNTHLFINFSKVGETIMSLEDFPLYGASCSISRLLENPSSTIDDSSQPMIYGDYYVIGTCKGLVCSASSFAPMPMGPSPYAREFEEFWVRFFNPVTRVTSQDSPRMCLRSSDYTIGRYVMFGFGYDDSSDTCKVVAVFIDIKSRQREARVYNLGDTCWRKTLTCPPVPFLGVSGQFVCGTVNWLALRNSSYSDYRWDHVIDIDQLVLFSYDLKNETYRYLLKPAGLVEVPSYVEPLLGVLNGCLCISYNNKRSHFVVWLMKEFGDENSWTRLLNVSHEDLQIHNPSWEQPFCMSEDEDEDEDEDLQIHKPSWELPFCMSEDEDVVLLTDGSCFILYNRRDNRMDSSGDFINKQMVFSYDYVQSLALPY